MTRILHSLEDTLAAGRDLAASLAPGDVLALAGDLGAGKTHLCKGIVAGLDTTDPVTSPTFTLVHEYRSGRLPVAHFDFYRLNSEEELLQIGWDDYLDGENVVLVEWADRFPHLIPPGARWFRLSILGGDARELRAIDAPDPS